MQILEIGPLTVRALGSGEGPAILLCHGFGAPGDDLVPLARAVDVGPGVRWFFPAAPLELEWGGRAWWEIDLDRRMALAERGESDALRLETPPGLAEARAALEATLASLEKDHGVRRDRLIVGGFSQGAMLTTEVSLAAETPFAGLVILSGTLLSQGAWAAAARARGSSLHVLMTHGRRDPLLRFADAEVLRELLLAGGASVEWVAHGGQHEIPMAALERLGAFARSRFGGA
jgi:phospholipase/carboxylesterase